MNSVLLAMSMLTGVDCGTLFLTAIAQVNRKIELTNPELEAFAKSACSTSNPDIIWQIAYVESGFKTLIIRSNDDSGGQVLRDDDARIALGELKETGNWQGSRNLDLGILQINFRAHGKKFNNDPHFMINPVNQVGYLVNQMMSELHAKCGDLWIGCYHSWKTPELAIAYQGRVTAAKKKLTNALGVSLELSDRLLPKDEIQRLSEKSFGRKAVANFKKPADSSSQKMKIKAALGKDRLDSEKPFFLGFVHTTTGRGDNSKKSLRVHGTNLLKEAVIEERIDKEKTTKDQNAFPLSELLNEVFESQVE